VRRLTGAVVAAAGLAAGAGACVALVWGGYTTPPDLVGPTLALALAVGWSFVGVGLLAWLRRPDSWTGPLMVLLGLAWFARFLVAVATPAGFVAGVLVGSVYLSVLVHLVVTFPTGRLASRAERVVVVAAYLLSAPLDLAFLLLGASRGIADGPPPNGLVITTSTTAFSFDPDPVDLAVQTVILAVFVAVLVLTLRRWRRAGAAQRRVLGPGVWGGVVIIATIMMQRTVFLLVLPATARIVFTWAAQVVLVVWPVVLLAGVLRSRLDRSAVGAMMTEIGTGLAPLQDVLARTLHDPSVRLAYWLADRQVCVDAHGVPLAVGGDGRALAYLERDGVRLAVLEYDAALADEPELVRAVAAGASLAVENEQLQAEIRAQLREVQASRARIVEAADAARRRVERDLHDGAQQRLVAVALALKLARRQLSRAAPEEVAALLDQAGGELSSALEELRELARGIYPVLLSDGGLGPALEALAARSPVPASVVAAPARRLPGPVEQTAYFVVSEALANAAKHARAGEVRVAVRDEGGLLVVEVDDDGVGGADPSGSGLRGLADRVAAAAGTLEINSPAGVGTRLRACLRSAGDRVIPGPEQGQPGDGSARPGEL
jgi:signal transduction histidine kinase